MLQIMRTHEFDAWIGGLRDKVGQRQVLARLARLSLGHWGDCKPVGGEVTELRIDSGPGYRVYCWKDGATVVVALGGGDKSGQETDRKFNRMRPSMAGFLGDLTPLKSAV